MSQIEQIIYTVNRRVDATWFAVQSSQLAVVIALPDELRMIVYDYAFSSPLRMYYWRDSLHEDIFHVLKTSLDVWVERYWQRLFKLYISTDPLIDSDWASIAAAY